MMHSISRSAPRLIPLLLAACLASCAAPTPAALPSSSTPEQPSEPALELSWATTTVMDVEEADDMWDFSGHTIRLKLYPAGMLGGDSDIAQAVQIGTVSCIQSTPSGQIDIVPQLALLDIPYLFPDAQLGNDHMEGVLRDWFQPYYNQAGLQLLDWRICGYRHLTCRYPVTTVQDLAGLSLRTMDNPYHQTFWRSLGALPTGVPFEDLHYALKMSKIDGQENALGAIVNSKLETGQHFLIPTRHLPHIFAYVMNLDQYQALTAQQRDLVGRYFTQKAEDAAADCTQKEKEQLTQLTGSGGLELLSPSQTFLAELYRGRQAVVERLRQDLGSELVEEFLSLMGTQPQN